MRKAAYPDNKLTQKMRAMGWDNVQDFYNNSDVKNVASRNTIRMLLIHNHRIVEPIFIKIAEALKFTPNEIKELLAEFGYHDFVDLIGDHQGTNLTKREKALLNIFNKISSKRPIVEPSVINFLESVCISSEIDCLDDLRVLRKKETL